MVADLVDHDGGDARGEGVAFLFDDDRREARRAALAGLRVGGADEQAHPVGGFGVAGPALLAGDHPFVAIEHGASLDVGEIGASGGFGEAGGADPFAAGAHFEELAAAIAGRVLGAAALGAGDDAGDAHPGAGEFFGDHAVFEDAKTQAAELFGYLDTEVALLTHAFEEPAGNLGLLGVKFVREREGFFHSEAASFGQDGFAFGRVVGREENGDGRR